MTILIGIIFLILIMWCVTSVFRAESSLRIVFIPAIILKSLAGIAVGMVYMFYYGLGDTLVFYEDALRLSELAQSDTHSYLQFLFKSEFAGNSSVTLSFEDKRVIFMEKIVSLFSLVSFDNYWLISFYMTLISFFASWYLVKQINECFPQATGAALVAFLFFPSIVFWTSGVIKETIAMASLYFICGMFVRVWCSKHVSLVNVVIACVAIYFLWTLKYYFAGIFLAVIFASIFYRFLSLRYSAFSRGIGGHLTWLAIFVTLIAGVTFLHPNFQANRLLDVMVNNYEVFHQVSKPEGLIYFDDLQATPGSMILNSPKALFAGLFRPLFFDANNVFAYLISVENIFLLGLSVFALKYLRLVFSRGVGVLLCAIVVYVILLAIFITLSTPNLGTLARYRVGYLPFFVFLILLVPPIANRLQNFFRIPAKAISRS